MPSSPIALPSMSWLPSPRPVGGARPARLLATVSAALVAVLALLVATAAPAAAHSELLQASPGPGQQAGGTIDFIDLAFLDAVSDALVEVTFQGVAVPGTMDEVDGQIIRFSFDEPLSVPGRYDVSYAATSSDLDRQTETYFFTYEPASPQAFRLGDPDQGSEGGGWTGTRIVASLVLVGCLCGLAFLYLTRLERRRAVADDHSVDR